MCFEGTSSHPGVSCRHFSQECVFLPPADGLGLKMSIHPFIRPSASQIVIKCLMSATDSGSLEVIESLPQFS